MHQIFGSDSPYALDQAASKNQLPEISRPRRGITPRAGMTDIIVKTQLDNLLQNDNPNDISSNSIKIRQNSSTAKPPLGFPVKGNILTYPTKGSNIDEFGTDTNPKVQNYLDEKNPNLPKIPLTRTSSNTNRNSDQEMMSKIKDLEFKVNSFKEIQITQIKDQLGDMQQKFDNLAQKNAALEKNIQNLGKMINSTDPGDAGTAISTLQTELQLLKDAFQKDKASKDHILKDLSNQSNSTYESMLKNESEFNDKLMKHKDELARAQNTIKDFVRKEEEANANKIIEESENLKCLIAKAEKQLFSEMMKRLNNLDSKEIMDDKFQQLQEFFDKEQKSFLEDNAKFILQTQESIMNLNEIIKNTKAQLETNLRASSTDTLSKLSKAAESLNDKIHMVEGSVEDLHKHQLKTNNMFHDLISKIQKKMEEEEGSKKKIWKDIEDGVQAKTGNLDEKLDGLKKELENKILELTNSLRNEFDGKTNENLEKTKNSVNRGAAEMKDIRERIENLNKDLLSDIGKLNDTKKIDNLLQKINEMSKLNEIENEKLNDKLSKMQSEINHKLNKEEISKINDSISDLDKIIKQNKDYCDKSNSNIIRDLNDKHNKLQSSLDDLFDKLHQKISVKSAQKSAIDEQKDSISNLNQNISNQILKLQEKHDRLDKALTKKSLDDEEQDQIQKIKEKKFNENLNKIIEQLDALQNEFHHFKNKPSDNTVSTPTNSLLNNFDLHKINEDIAQMQTIVRELQQKINENAKRSLGSAPLDNTNGSINSYKGNELHIDDHDNNNLKNNEIHKNNWHDNQKILDKILKLQATVDEEKIKFQEALTHDIPLLITKKNEESKNEINVQLQKISKNCENNLEAHENDQVAELKKIQEQWNKKLDEFKRLTQEDSAENTNRINTDIKNLKQLVSANKDESISNEDLIKKELRTFIKNHEESHLNYQNYVDQKFKTISNEHREMTPKSVIKPREYSGTNLLKNQEFNKSQHNMIHFKDPNNASLVNEKEIDFFRMLNELRDEMNIRFVDSNGRINVISDNMEKVLENQKNLIIDNLTLKIDAAKNLSLSLNEQSSAEITRVENKILKHIKARLEESELLTKEELDHVKKDLENKIKHCTKEVTQQKETVENLQNEMKTLSDEVKKEITGKLNAIEKKLNDQNTLMQNTIEQLEKRIENDLEIYQNQIQTDFDNLNKKVESNFEIFKKKLENEFDICQHSLKSSIELLSEKLDESNFWTKNSLSKLKKNIREEENSREASEYLESLYSQMYSQEFSDFAYFFLNKLDFIDLDIDNLLDDVSKLKNVPDYEPLMRQLISMIQQQVNDNTDGITLCKEKLKTVAEKLRNFIDEITNHVNETDIQTNSKLTEMNKAFIENVNKLEFNYSELQKNQNEIALNLIETKKLQAELTKTTESQKLAFDQELATIDTRIKEIYDYIENMMKSNKEAPIIPETTLNEINDQKEELNSLKNKITKLSEDLNHMQFQLEELLTNVENSQPTPGNQEEEHSLLKDMLQKEISDRMLSFDNLQEKIKDLEAKLIKIDSRMLPFEQKLVEFEEKVVPLEEKTTQLEEINKLMEENFQNEKEENSTKIQKIDFSIHSLWDNISQCNSNFLEFSDHLKEYLNRLDSELYFEIIMTRDTSEHLDKKIRRLLKNLMNVESNQEKLQNIVDSLLNDKNIKSNKEKNKKIDNSANPNELAEIQDKIASLATSSKNLESLFKKLKDDLKLKIEELGKQISFEETRNTNNFKVFEKALVDTTQFLNRIDSQLYMESIISRTVINELEYKFCNAQQKNEVNFVEIFNKLKNQTPYSKQPEQSNLDELMKQIHQINKELKDLQQNYSLFQDKTEKNAKQFTHQIMEIEIKIYMESLMSKVVTNKLEQTSLKISDLKWVEKRFDEIQNKFQDINKRVAHSESEIYLVQILHQSKLQNLQNEMKNNNIIIIDIIANLNDRLNIPCNNSIIQAYPFDKTDKWPEYEKKIKQMIEDSIRQQNEINKKNLDEFKNKFNKFEAGVYDDFQTSEQLFNHILQYLNRLDSEIYLESIYSRVSIKNLEDKAFTAYKELVRIDNKINSGFLDFKKTLVYIEKNRIHLESECYLLRIFAKNNCQELQLQIKEGLKMILDLIADVNERIPKSIPVHYDNPPMALPKNDIDFKKEAQMIVSQALDKQNEINKKTYATEQQLKILREIVDQNKKLFDAFEDKTEKNFKIAENMLVDLKQFSNRIDSELYLEIVLSRSSMKTLEEKLNLVLKKV